ncbi:9809_t:CDS:2, partial [Acaulospora colombiana]
MITGRSFYTYHRPGKWSMPVATDHNWTCILATHGGPLEEEERTQIALLILFDHLGGKGASIPTLVAYQNGTPQFFGVEAAGYIGDDDYEMAQWFKLHLHPSSMKESDLPPPFGSTTDVMPQIEIPPLPTSVNLYQSKTMFIFCHPNGWDVSQQGFLTTCAVQACMLKNEEASTRVSFVTEGEASVHYALAYTPSNSWLKRGEKFLVVDAGGSTIDSNFYECSSIAPLKLKEVGGVFVDRAARKLLERKLTTSAKYNSEEIISEMTSIFEQKTKRLFGGSLPSNIIHFGRNSDNDREHSILKGKLTLTNEEISSTFEESIARTVQSCMKILGNQRTRFGESPHLRTRITDEFRPLGTEVIVVDQPSEGAIIWNLKRAVALRVSRLTLGIKMDTVYNHDLQEHRD